MPQDNPGSTYLDRLIALKLLRENMFYDQPTKYTFSDIAEDLPGAARAVTPIIKNVLPTAAIVSRDPEERKAQIRRAIERIQTSGESNSSLGKEMLHNIKSMGLGALPPAFLLAAGVHLLGFRSPLMRSRGGKMSLRSPIAPGEVINKLRNQKGYARHMAQDSLSEAAQGAGIGALHGAITPLFASGYKPSEQSLEEAGKIMESQPYAASLPSGEMLSVMSGGKEDGGLAGKLKSIGLGTALGIATGIGGSFMPAKIKALGYAGRNLLQRKPISTGIKEMLAAQVKRDVPRAAMMGAGLGALSGAITDRMGSEKA